MAKTPLTDSIYLRSDKVCEKQSLISETQRIHPLEDLVNKRPIEIQELVAIDKALAQLGSNVLSNILHHSSINRVTKAGVGLGSCLGL